MLALTLTATPALAGTGALSYKNSTPIKPVTSGQYVTFKSGGATNSAWAQVSSGMVNLGMPSGGMIAGLESAAFTYGGATGGTLRTSISGAFTYNWSCTSVAVISQAQGRAYLIARLWDITAAKQVSMVTTYSVDLPLCGGPIVSQSTGVVSMPSDQPAVFSGSGLIKGHSYRLLAGIEPMIATTAMGAAANLLMTEQSLSGSFSY